MVKKEENEKERVREQKREYGNKMEKEGGG